MADTCVEIFTIVLSRQKWLPLEILIRRDGVARPLGIVCVDMRVGRPSPNRVWLKGKLGFCKKNSGRSEELFLPLQHLRSRSNTVLPRSGLPNRSWSKVDPTVRRRGSKSSCVLRLTGQLTTLRRERLAQVRASLRRRALESVACQRHAGATVTTLTSLR
jgi:hypothetical protein